MAKLLYTNDGTLKSVPDCYKNQETCNKTVENYPHALEFFPECYRTHKICNKAFQKCCLAYINIPDRYKTQEMCDRVIYKDRLRLFIIFLPDQYQTQ